ncbi:hypothetical protein H0O00_02265 [Candidatus Micrarchaeota archaeon]|nr:hypothetical protein [Candidatus Micrarchaeota archaeon]
MNHTGKLVLSATSADRQSATGPAQSSPMKKLQPLNETINGLPVYGNQEGQRFTVRTVGYFGVKELANDVAHVEIKEVKDEKPYRVLGRVDLTDSAAYISDITNSEAPVPYFYVEPETKGLGFFQIILEHVQKLARETGKKAIEIVPENTKLAGYYSGFGFEKDSTSVTGKLRLELES